jgi:hypothetical protein
MAGFARWITRCTCAMWVVILGSTSICRPTTSVHRWPNAPSTCRVDAAGKHFVVWHEDQMIKTLPIKGLIGEEMAIDDFLKHMQQEALAQERRSQASAPWGLRQFALW